MTKILIADEDLSTRADVESYFATRGFQVSSAGNGREALDRYYAEKPDAILLERDLPEPDGFAVCRTLRDRPADGKEIPVLFVARRADLPARIAAFESGADDFVPKPIAVEEVFARVQALLRRTRGARVDVLTAGDLVIDRARHRVTRAGEEIPLTLTEYRLLEYLVRNANVALSRKQILDAVWGGTVDGFTNIVDVYINYLRRKIERESAPKLIHTVRGVGYMFEARADGNPVEAL